ncbi:MAG TPA: CHAP domain-containing protein [Candidatus Saccharimonadia bacterium]|nr:CHAP domain-containing protein [Candidatus Saccharimonadia bacterium]
MDAHPYLSSYLTTTPATRAKRGKLRNRWRLIITFWPRLSWRTWSSLALWAVLFAMGSYAMQHHQLPLGGHSIAASNSRPASAPAVAAARLASATKAMTLPGGPTGQLLPPGTMAAFGTYANSYAWGQCTWYVATRRPIPTNWGNARNWLSHAQAAGWGTGSAPAVAAIAWTSEGYYGHVALVEDVDAENGQVLISEMNYTGLDRIDKRWAPISSFKYIY